MSPLRRILVALASKSLQETYSSHVTKVGHFFLSGVVFEAGVVFTRERGRPASGERDGAREGGEYS